MYDQNNPGKQLTKEYADRRMSNEVLTEMAQCKGQSETHPSLSGNDEFANFELVETLLSSTAKAKFKTGSYVRQAYGVGQELPAKLVAIHLNMGCKAEPISTPGFHQPKKTIIIDHMLHRMTLKKIIKPFYQLPDLLVVPQTGIEPVRPFRVTGF